MNIEDFWNQALLAALARLPAARAKQEADRATLMCIDHWKTHQAEYAPQYLTRWQHQEIGLVPLLFDELPRMSSDALSDQVRSRAKAQTQAPRARPLRADALQPQSARPLAKRRPRQRTS